MRERILIVLLLAFSSCAFAQSSTDQARSAAIRFGQAWAKNDVGTLKQLLAADYMHTDTDGKVLNKQQWLAYVQDRIAKKITNKMKFADVKSKELAPGVVAVTGENIVSGGLANEKVNAGKLFHIRFTQIWTRRSGEWKRTYFQGTPIL